MATRDQHWFAVRCVFEWPSEAGECRTYEERLTLWRARSLDEAISKAKSEVAQYAQSANPALVPLDLAQAYALAEEPGEGGEVFSLLRDSDLDGPAYLDRHFDTGTEHQH